MTTRRAALFLALTLLTFALPAQASIDALRAQKPAPVTALARWYALTGDADTALRLLEEAAGQGMRLQSIKNDPDFDRLRANARFTALLQRF